MMMGARTAAWANAGGGVPTARDYVQDGLVRMFDGIENDGYGKHDANMSTWRELVTNTMLSSSEMHTMKNGGSNYYYGGNMNQADSKEIGYLAQIWSTAMFSMSITISFPDGIKKGGWNYSSPIASVATSCNADNVALQCYGQGWQWFYFSPGDLVNVCFSLDGKEGIIYANGVALPRVYTVPEIHDVTFSRPYGWENSNPTYRHYHNFRIYNRPLSAAEIAANYAIDKARFGLT